MSQRTPTPSRPDRNLMEAERAERTALLDGSPPPPPIRRSRTKLAVLTGAGLALAAMLVVIVLNLDRGSDVAQRPEFGNVIELIPPPSLMSDGDQAAEAGDLEDITNIGAEDAGIDVVDPETGRLAQRYRFERLQPSPAGRPAGWLGMEQPEVELYLDDDRVLTLEGDSALVRAPNRALESGTMTGNVIIRLHDRRDGIIVQPPTMEMRTDEAAFDNFQGEVTCPGWVDIQTPTAHLPGEGLRLQFNELEERLERIEIRAVTGPIRLAQLPAMSEPPIAETPAIGDPDEQINDQQTPEAAATSSNGGTAVSAVQSTGTGETPVPPETRADQPRVERGAARRGGARAGQPGGNASGQSARERRQARRNRQAETAAPPPPPMAVPSTEPVFYRLVFRDNVQVWQGGDAPGPELATGRESGSLQADSQQPEADSPSGWIASGDELHVILSLEGGGLNNAFAVTRPRQRARVMIAVPSRLALPAALTSLAIAAAQDPQLIAAGLYQSGDNETFITCEGGLTMVPLVNVAERPDSIDDMRFELIGSPARLRNPIEHTEITCRTLAYQSQAERLQLAGDETHPLTIDSPQLRAEARRFWLNRPENRGAFEGAGWMAAVESQNADPDTVGPIAAGAGELRIAWRDDVQLEFAPVAAESDAPDKVAGKKAGFGAGELGRLRAADFNGAVAVSNPDLNLTSDTMRVTFAEVVQAPAADDVVEEAGRHETSIESMHAKGGAGAVHVVSLADDGSLSSDELDVRFARDDFGRTSPSHLTATGHVAAVDPASQTVWSDVLEVEFAPPPPPPPPAAAALAADVTPALVPAATEIAVNEAAAPQPEPSARRAADVKSLRASGEAGATGRVQVLLSDGSRAFGDLLEADGATGRIVLTGEDVFVASERTIIHEGTRLEIERDKDTAIWPGPGEFVSYTKLVVPESRERIDRAALESLAGQDNPTQLIAHWEDRLTYDGAWGDGAGSIVLDGAIHATSTPSLRERNTMTANESVTLYFAKVEPDLVENEAGAAPAGAEIDATNEPPAGQAGQSTDDTDVTDEATNSALSVSSAPSVESHSRLTADTSNQVHSSLLGTNAGGKRKLKQMIARGDARLESRTWLTDEHTDVPRIFYVRGDHITHDDETLESLVDGPGELLVRDERPDAANGVKVAADDAESPPPLPVRGRAREGAPSDPAFSGKGTTHFKWTDRLHMKQIAGNEYEIDMAGGVEVRHMALAENALPPPAVSAAKPAISTMTGDRLRATVERSAAATTAQRDTAFDLGGSMELRKLHGSGNIYINTPTRDVDCNEFVYDYATGIALLTALPGREVVVTTAGSAHPFRARAVTWNMIDDTIEATGVTGGTRR